MNSAETTQEAKKEKMKSKKKYLTTLLIICLIGIAYATLRTTFFINGTATISKQNWDLHFESINDNIEGNVVIDDNDKKAHILSTDTTTIEYEPTFQTPGDFYEFTVKMVNSGTLNAMIDSIELDILDGEGNPLPAESENVLEFDIMYNGTGKEGIELKKNQKLLGAQAPNPAGSNEELIRVRTAYKKEITEDELNAMDNDGITALIRCKINYVQENTSVSVDVPKDNEKTFANLSWTAIAEAVRAGTGAVYNALNVGDTKTVKVKIGSNYEDHTIRIANKSTEGCDAEGFSQTACGVVFEFAETVGLPVSFSTTATSAAITANGYVGSTTVRNALKSIYNGLPISLRGQIYRTKTLVPYGSGGSENTMLEELLYLPSVTEVFGDDQKANETIGNKTRQLDYYRNASNSKVKPSTYYGWWTRSIRINNSSYGIQYVSKDGNAAYGAGEQPNGLSPAFRLDK